MSRRISLASLVRLSVLLLTVMVTLQPLPGWGRQADTGTPAPTGSTLIIENVVATDGSDATGSMICVTLEDGMPAGQCVNWAGEPITFAIPAPQTVSWTATPSPTLPLENASGSTTLGSGEIQRITITLSVSPVVTVSPTPTSEPISTDEPTATAATIPTIEASATSSATVVAQPETPDAQAPGDATPTATLPVMRPMDAVTGGIVQFRLTAPDGSVVSSGFNICLTFSDLSMTCSPNQTEFQAPPGEAAYQIQFPTGSSYGDISGTVTIPSGQTVVVEQQVKPRPSGQITVTAKTVDGQPVPDQTTVCYQLVTSTEQTCAVLPASGILEISNLADGTYYVSVNPPIGSAYESVSNTVSVAPGADTRFDVTLSRKADALLQFVVNTKDVSGQVPQYAYICVTFANSTKPTCVYGGYSTQNPDGSRTYSVPGPAGSFTWYFETQSATYIGQRGSGTVAAGETKVIPIELGRSQGTGTVEITVTTENGGPVPPSTEVCIQPYYSQTICQYIGDGVSSSVKVTFSDVPDGNAQYSVTPPGGVGYFPARDLILVSANTTTSQNVVLLAFHPDTLVKTVDHSEAHSGDGVTYYLRGSFSTGSFRLSDTLPANFALDTVACTGEFAPDPVRCYDQIGSTLTVHGTSLDGAGGSYEIILSGHITGNPGDVVTNQACTVPYLPGGLYSSREGAAFGLSGTGGRFNPAVLQISPPPSSCSSASTTILAPGTYEMSVHKELVSVNGETGQQSATVGDKLSYQIVVRNIGTTELTNVMVVDSKIDSLTCEPAVPATLAVNAEIRCTGMYTVTQDDVDRHVFINTATAVSDQTPPKEDTVTLTIEEPVYPIPPVKSALCGPLNDVITVPTQPDYVVVSSSGWYGNDWVVTFTAKAGYRIVGKSYYEFDDRNIPCPAGTVTPSPTPNVTPASRLIVTPVPGRVATVTPTTGRMPVVPATYPTPTSPDGVPSGTTSTSRTHGMSETTSSSPSSSAVVRSLPSTGGRTDGGHRWMLAPLASMFLFGAAIVTHRRSARL